MAGNNIRKLREQAEISQEELAAGLQLAGLDLTQKAISRIETSDRVLPDFELLYFADFFHISVLDLLKES